MPIGIHIGFHKKNLLTYCSTIGNLVYDGGGVEESF